MTPNLKTEEIEQGIDYQSHPELAIATVLHMMTRFPDTPKLSIVASIINHLRQIADDARHIDAVRHAASIALSAWQARLAEAVASRQGSRHTH